MRETAQEAIRQVQHPSAQAYVRSPPRGALLALAGLLLVLMASPAEARLDFVEHDTDAFNGVELAMYQSFPDNPIPTGNEYVWTVTAFSGVSQMDEVAFSGIKVAGDCIVVDLTNNTFTPTFVEVNVTIRMTGPACYMEAGASAVDGGVLGVGDVEAHGHLSATVVAFTMHDFGQAPRDAVADWYFPLLLWVGLAVLFSFLRRPGAVAVALMGLVGVAFLGAGVPEVFALLLLPIVLMVEQIAYDRLGTPWAPKKDNDNR